MSPSTLRRSSSATRRFVRYVRRSAATFILTWRAAGKRPITSTAVTAACSLASILLITSLAGIQEPEVHDELAQLVQADIFAHGRLAEPPHFFWQHFETMHMLPQPSYQAKYPPGPALLMAVGEKLAGFPIVGVWVGVLVMILAMGYAMHGLLPGRWAVVGTALVALRFGIVGDWPHSYWGGALTAAGGALVLGASVRLWNAPRARDGALLGTGLVLLVLTRPYEGLSYSLPVIALLGFRACRPSAVRSALWRRAVPAALAIGVLGCSWLAYYNWRVTGSPLLLPYIAYERLYSAAPLFVWQKPREPSPSFRNREMERFEGEFTLQEAVGAQRHWPVIQLENLGRAAWDYLKPALPLAFIGLFIAHRPMRKRIMAAIPLVSMFGAMLLACWVAPRYMAAGTASLFALATAGLSGLWRFRRRWANGQLLVIGIVLLLAAAVPLAAVQYVIRIRTSSDWWAAKRDIRQQLIALPGNDLVFVRYKPSHNPHTEWVYNGADIDHQPIVWARELDPASNERLRGYFNDRQVWVVLADEHPRRLVKWPGQTEHAANGDR